LEDTHSQKHLVAIRTVTDLWMPAESHVFMASSTKQLWYE
jgi:hypothetical protein